MELGSNKKLDEVLRLMATSFALKPFATDEQVFKELKKVHPELENQNDLWSEVISILESLVKEDYVTIINSAEAVAKYKISTKGRKAFNQSIPMNFENRETLMEQAIEYLKEHHGYSNHIHMPFEENIWGFLEKILLQYGLISMKESSIGISLTQKGWEFESFKKLKDDSQLQKDLIVANINTNKSIVTLNEKTEDFYTKQKDFNKVQSGLTWTIAISSFVYTVFTVLTFWKGCNSELPQQSKCTQEQLQEQSKNKTKQLLINYDSLKNTKSQSVAPAKK